MRELNLRGASRGERPRVLRQRLERVHAVVDRALDVVHGVLGGSTEDDGGDAGGLVVLLDDDALGPANLDEVDGGDVAELVSLGSAELDDAGGVGGAAEPSELELGGDLDGHEVVALDEVHGHLAEGLAGDHNLRAGFGDLLDVLLHLLLLAEGVILELLTAGDEHGALGLRGGGVHGAAEHGNLGVLHVLHRALDVAANHHALHDFVLVEARADDLRDADVVHVEVELVLRAHVDARLRARLRE
mmetsp:Transcript_182433/g.444042  ORF Transcript_182433/g.444042 Transcript_182433/m.444042 type:complete len:245 (-) Transcript_182433:593-1327(-)